MKNDFYIVSKTVVPGCIEKVIEARELLRSGKVKDISEAAKRVGISRSTYYKYKDQVFRPKDGYSGRRLVISMLLSHEPGVLGRVLSMMSEDGVNILTINQNPPIDDRASVVISMDISSLSIDVRALIEKLKDMDGVENPAIMDMA